ncbi:MAG: hypothetical protein QOG04_208 [Actinomycetota bacterium]|jgi:hypothetical protein|nr:hypothetical protein [Actinomycetota bacterium]
MTGSGSKLDWAKWILGASLVATVIHYTDNYINIADYPQPEFIDHKVVVIAWLAFTLFGILGYLLLTRGQTFVAGLAFLVYSYTALSSLGHYKFGSMAVFTPKMHLFIWMDALTGAAVLGLAIWCLSDLRKPISVV